MHPNKWVTTSMGRKQIPLIKYLMYFNQLLREYVNWYRRSMRPNMHHIRGNHWAMSHQGIISGHQLHSQMDSNSDRKYHHQSILPRKWYSPLMPRGRRNIIDSCISGVMAILRQESRKIGIMIGQCRRKNSDSERRRIDNSIK